jgi:hypothetical protein
VLLSLWDSLTLIGMVQLMIESPHLALSIVLALHLLHGLVKGNLQLLYPLWKLSIVLQFLQVRRFFGFDNSLQSLAFNRIVPPLFGVIIRVLYTSLATHWNINGPNTLRSTCTSFTNSSKMVFSTWSICLLKRKLLISSLNLWHHLTFYSYD